MKEEGVQKLFEKEWSALKKINLGRLCDMQVITKLEMEDYRPSSAEHPNSYKCSIYVIH